MTITPNNKPQLKLKQNHTPTPQKIFPSNHTPNHQPPSTPTTKRKNQDSVV